jgi:hypothetical protein
LAEFCACIYDFSLLLSNVCRIDWWWDQDDPSAVVIKAELLRIKKADSSTWAIFDSAK